MAAEHGAGGDWPQVEYPQTRRDDVVDDYHGVEVADPYRWLEQLEAPETREWVERQNRLTRGVLDALPGREHIERRLRQLWDHDRYEVPVERAGRAFYLRNSGLQEHAVLCVVDSEGAEPRVLLDPNQLSDDGTVALAGWSLSDDGRHLAYGVSSGGSDWQVWRVREVESGRDLADELQWVKFSLPAWAPDGSGFYYGRYAPPDDVAELYSAVNYDQKVYFHRLGEQQHADRLVYERPDHKDWGFGLRVSDDGRYLVLQVWRGSEERNGIFYLDLERPEQGVVELLDQFDAAYAFVGNQGPVFWLRTNRQAPRYRLVAVDIRSPQPEAWRELIPERGDTLSSVSAVGGRLFACSMRDAHNVVDVYNPDGSHLRSLELPGIGTAWGFSGRWQDSRSYYAYMDFARPTTIYRLDTAALHAVEYLRPERSIDPERFVTRQVFYTSRDGTRIPMFLSHRRDLQPDADTPTLLYGYGGFNVPVLPSYSASLLVWMELGGVFASANLRGGGEYGQQWHEAGTRINKQNVFDDFIAAAEWLRDEGLSSPRRLAIMGRSNGGLLVGAAMTQRPELFAAAVPGVGVLDMLRYHKFTIGWAWASDFGTSDDPEEFRALHAYSPLHNVREGAGYPATLVVTGDHDDRVVPAHSYKFAATLQATRSSGPPALLRVETRAGHGATTPTSLRIEETLDVWLFLAHALGMDLEPTASD